MKPRMMSKPNSSTLYRVVLRLKHRDGKEFLEFIGPYSQERAARGVLTGHLENSYNTYRPRSTVISGWVEASAANWKVITPERDAISNA